MPIECCVCILVVCGRLWNESDERAGLSDERVDVEQQLLAPVVVVQLLTLLLL